jgi:hypothetical protein
MTWRVRELGGVVAVLPSSQKRSNASSSESSSRRERFQSLSPVRGLRKARVFVSCLTASEVESGDSVGKFKGTGEALVVDKEQMAAVLLDFRTKWNVEHPVTNNGRGYGSPNSNANGYGHWLGAWGYLGFETGIDPSVIGKISRCEMPIVSLTKAEKILMAMGLQHMLSNGEIQVLKNPNWSWRQLRLWRTEQMR